MRRHRSVSSQIKHQGFTLLEVIVVLLIMSFITVMMMEGLTHYLKVQERISNKLSESHVSSLQSFWFRDVVGGLMSSEDASWQFTGNATRFAGVSVKGLDQQEGVPSRFVMDLDRHDERLWLTYYPESQLRVPDQLTAYQLIKKAEAWVLFPVLDQVHFVYVGVDGQQYAQWPPKNTRVKGLPEGVIMRGEKRKGEVLGYGYSYEYEQWASVKGDKRAPHGFVKGGVE